MPRYTCFLYAEGGEDKKFLGKLVNLEKFKYHTQKWFINPPTNYHGCSPKDILIACRDRCRGADYDLVICFIDRDALKNSHKNWQEEQKKLENEFKDINIIWMIEKAEDEYRRILGIKTNDKYRINKIALGRIEEFINSEIWKKLISLFRDREMSLNKKVGKKTK